MFSRKSSTGGRKNSIPEQVVLDISTQPSQPAEPAAPVNTPSMDEKELLLQAQGAVFENQNKELVKRIAELKTKREEITTTIAAEEAEMLKYDEQKQLLEARLDEVNDALTKKRGLVLEYNKIIEETESAYNKLLESSMSLLSVLEKETLDVHKSRSRTVSVNDGEIM